MTDTALRELERSARTAPSGASWAALAQALARAGRGADARVAAVRALHLDPTSPVRDLLPATPAPPTSWPGPRALGAPREWTVDGHVDDVLDLGGGRLLVVTGPGTFSALRGALQLRAGSSGELVALDPFGGAVAWRGERADRVGWARPPVVADGAVVEVELGDAQLFAVVRDAPSGAPTGRFLLFEGDHLVFDEPEDANAPVAAGRYVVVRGRTEELQEVARWFDPRAGRVHGRVRIGVSDPMVAGEEGLVLLEPAETDVAAPGSILAHGPASLRWAWTGPAATPLDATPDVVVAAVSKGHEELHDVVVLDARTGAVRCELGPFAMPWARATAEHVVVVERHLLKQVDHVRATLHGARLDGGPRLWSRPLGVVVDLDLHATRDLLVVTPSVPRPGLLARGRERTATLGLDAAAGELLWERPAAPAEDGPPRPVGGQLVTVERLGGLLRPTSIVRVHPPG